MFFVHGSTCRKKKKYFFLSLLFLILPVVIITGVFIYGRITIGVNKGNIGYCMQDEKLTISWQTVSDRNKYRFSRYDDNSGEYVFCGEYADGRAELTGVVPGQELRLKMQGVRTVRVFGYPWEISGKPRILTVVPQELECPVLERTADYKKRNMKITWDTVPGDRYEVYLMNGEGIFERYTEIEEGEIAVSLENHAELSGREQEIGIAVRTIRQMDDYTLYSAISDLAVINRVDLMGNELHLTYEEKGELRYILNWEESKGEWYELQEWSFRDKKWISRQVYRWSDALSYDTGRLPSCTRVRFRVITYNDTKSRDGEAYAAEPSEAAFRTEVSPLYCTIWPLTALDIFEDASGNKVAGRVPAGKALCVLEAAEGYFLVWYDNQYGYIDSRYCLIDLAEYLGNLCKYNITNSYSSIFRVHGYDIPEVTDGVIKGYENIHMRNGEMLIPYLYPCAQKLYKAALSAEEDGYFFCIYDAFRPNEATRYLYDTAEIILNRPVPEKDTEEEDGITEVEEIAEVIEVAEITEDTETAEESEAGSEEETSEELTQRIMLLSEELAPETTGILKDLSEEALMAFYALPREDLIDMSLAEKDIQLLKEISWEELEALKLYIDSMLTYQEVMTDNRFHLGSFLAQAISAHNRGIALDLTLGSILSEEELEMQSDMHDLSWYSIPVQNNRNADLLASYMKEAGYHGISSEWWHFQDDETRNQLNLGYMEEGISPEGWKKDELGWKYRLADGSYHYAETVTIDNKECTFNADGYLVEEQGVPAGCMYAGIPDGHVEDPND